MASANRAPLVCDADDDAGHSERSNGDDDVHRCQQSPDHDAEISTRLNQKERIPNPRDNIITTVDSVNPDVRILGRTRKLFSQKMST
jgi:hypothetical protein